MDLALKLIAAVASVAIRDHGKQPGQPFYYGREMWSYESPHRIALDKGLELMEYMNGLNKYLETYVKSEYPPLNFARCEESLRHDKRPKWVETYELFRSLRDVSGNNRCNLKSYNILHRNENAINGLPHWNLEVNFKGRRINKILKGYQESHAKDCRERYFELYREAVKKLKPGVKEFAETLVKSLMVRNRGKEEAEAMLGDAKKLERFVLEYPKISSKSVGDIPWCLQEIRRLTKDDPLRHHLEPVPTPWFGGRVLMKVNKEEARKLYYKHWEQPCRDYMLVMEQIFVPLEYDYRFYETPAKEDEQDFYLNWAAFELCDTMSLMHFGNIVPDNVVEYQERMAKEGKVF